MLAATGARAHLIVCPKQQRSASAVIDGVSRSMKTRCPCPCLSVGYASWCEFEDSRMSRVGFGIGPPSLALLCNHGHS
jgi:hypothetical protein